MSGARIVAFLRAHGWPLAFTVVYLVLVGLFVGCGERAADAVARATMPPKPVAGPIEPPPKTVVAADNLLNDALARAARAEHDLAVAHADIKQARAERDWLADERARARLAWTAGLLQLVVIGFGALAFFSPVWRTRLVLACVSTEAAAVLALALRAVYAWLPIVGAVVGVAFVATAVWKTVKLVRAARAAADHGDRMEAALLHAKDWFTGDESLLHELVAAVKVESAKAQRAAGVGTILARIRGADPERSAVMASLPVIRPTVAELPAPALADPQPHDAAQRIDLAPLIAKGDAQAPAAGDPPA